MKKWIIFWILLIVAITFVLTRPTKYYDEGHVVTKEEVTEYRESMSKYKQFTEEEINNMVDNYIKTNTREPSEKEIKGNDFKSALKTAVFISSIICVVPFVMSLIRRGQYYERYGVNYGERTPFDPFPDLIRFLRGKGHE